METKENKMGTEPVLRLLITMSLPAMFSMLIQSLYNIVDSIFVAQLGEQALRAVSLAFPLQMLIIAVAVGTGVGINSLISRRLGEKKFEEANEAANHGITLGIVWGIIFAIGGILFVKKFFQMSTDDATVIKMGCDYTYVIMLFSMGSLIHINNEKTLQATGNMVYPMLFQLAGAISNIILDPIFIFGWFGVPAMGVRGAAIATVTGQIIAMLFSVYVILVKNHVVEVHLEHLTLKKNVIIEIYKVGFPAMVMQSIGSLLIIGLNAILTSFSGAAVSVLGVYYKLQSFVFMPVFGLTQGAMPIMGYNYGARNKKRLTDTLKLAVVIALVIMTIGTIIFWTLPEQLLQMFNSTEEMILIGVPALRTISLCFVLAAWGVVCSVFFQAIGKGVNSLFISTLRQLIIILPAAYILANTFGLRAVWFAFPLAELVASIVSTIILIKMYRDYIQF